MCDAAVRWGVLSRLSVALVNACVFGGCFALAFMASYPLGGGGWGGGGGAGDSLGWGQGSGSIKGFDGFVSFCDGLISFCDGFVSILPTAPGSRICVCQ